MPKRESGRSHSIRPVSRRAPSWCKYEAEEVEALIIKLAKEGHSSSRIGATLRDQHGIPLTKAVTGKRITQILKEANMGPAIPEDLSFLLKKAYRMYTHMDNHKSDLANKRSLQVIEAKIHKLSKNYRRKHVLSHDWKYKPRVASIV